MKKNIAKLVALLLIFSLVMPMTVQAASYNYSLTITLSNADNSKGVTRTSGNYLSLEDNAIAAVAQTMLNEAVEAEIKTKFADSGLGSKFEDIKSAAYAALDGNTTEWVSWVDSCVADVEERNIIKDTESTLSALNSLNDKTITATYGSGYTLTVKLNATPIGTDGGTTKPTNPVVLVADETNPGTTPTEGQTAGIVKDGGTVEINKSTAATGEKVAVTATPNENKMINYVVVRDKDGNKLPLVYDGNGSYTFEMPEGGVTVTTTFCTEPADPTETGIAEVLDVDDHMAFMIGDDEGMFRPNDDINRAEVSMIFYRLLRNKQVEKAASFEDVSAQAWYAEAVETLAALGIVNGVGENNFEPMRSITRAEFAVICARLAKAMVGDQPFSDVNGHWAAEEISTAASYGWINGYEDGTFAPNKPITRQEAATIVNRMLYRLGDQVAIDDGHAAEFSDVNDDMWGWYQIAEATNTHGHELEDEFVHETWEK